MALIKCKECGHEVSSKAATCPNCGIEIARKPVVGSAALAVSPSSQKIIGTLADTVLELRGEAISSTQVGSDASGLLVEWVYPEATYLMGRRVQDGIEAYRVIQIE
jgi:hypothetical protein